MQPDLTTHQSAEFLTIRVHNYKDDLGHDHVSLHGLFTDRDEAERIARAVSVAWDFITADVLPIQSSAIANIAAAQRISHIEPDLPADFEQQDSQAASVAVPDDNTIVSAPGFADMTYRVASRTPGHPSNPHPVGSYLNPTRESIAAEVAADAEIMEALRAERADESQPAPVTEESLRQEFLDLSAEIGAAGERRCSYVYPNGSVCNKKDHLHHWNEHAFQDDLTEKFAAHVARHEAFLAEQTAEQVTEQVTEQVSQTPVERDPVADAAALAPVVHEADWTMAGPRWPWHQATEKQRVDAFLIAQHAIADPTMDDDALVALVERFWSTKPKHGAPRRVVAKVRKIREWLISEGLRESIDPPSDRS